MRARTTFAYEWFACCNVKESKRKLFYIYSVKEQCPPACTILPRNFDTLI